MNHIYKVVYCKETGTFVAVNEYAKAQGKSGSSSVGSSATASSVAKGFALTAMSAGMAMMGMEAHAARVDGNTNVGGNNGTNLIISGATGTQGTTANRIDNQIVIGNRATTVGTGGKSIAIGSVTDTETPTTASANFAIAIGSASGDGADWGTKATGNSSIALGVDARAENTSAVAVGRRTKATGSTSIAVGHEAASGGNNSIAIGGGAVADEKVAGRGGVVNGTYAANQMSTDGHNIAIGSSAKATGGTNGSAGGSIAIGMNTASDTQGSIALGGESVAGGRLTGDFYNRAQNGVSTGPATAYGQQIAVGSRVQAYGDQTVAIGNNTLAAGNSSIAIGGDDVGKIRLTRYTSQISGVEGTTRSGNALYLELTGTELPSVGTAGTASGDAGIAIGSHANAGTKDHVGSIEGGHTANRDGAFNIAVGVGSTAIKLSSTAIGTGAKANAAGSNAMGANAVSDTRNSIALGTASHANGKAGSDYEWVVVNGNLQQAAIPEGANLPPLATASGQIAIGQNAKTNSATGTQNSATAIHSGQHAIAIGTAATTNYSFDIAIGAGSKVETVVPTGGTIGADDVGAKQRTNRDQMPSMAIGALARSGGQHGDVIIGPGATSAVNTKYSTGQGTAIGSRATVYGDQSLAIGADTRAIGDSSVAIGGDDLDKVIVKLKEVDDTITSTASLATVKNLITDNTEAQGLVNTSSNYPNTASVGGASVAIGPASQTLGIGSVAHGANALAYGKGSIAMGLLARSGDKDTPANAEDTIAIGTHANASGNESIAIGRQNTASGKQSIAIGVGNKVSGNSSGAFGDPSINAGTGSYTFGNDNVVGSTTTGAFALGNNNQMGATPSYQPVLDAQGQPIAGQFTKKVDNTQPLTAAVDVSGSAIVGSENKVTTKDTFVLGSGINVGTDGKAAQSGTVANSVYLGKDSTAIAAAGKNKTDADAEGATTTAGATGTVTEAKIGPAGQELTYDGFAGSVGKGAVTVGSAGGERRIMNVAAGEISATSTDAINGSQLYAVADKVARGFDILESTAGSTNVKGTVQPGDRVQFLSGDAATTDVVTEQETGGLTVVKITAKTTGGNPPASTNLSVADNGTVNLPAPTDADKFVNAGNLEDTLNKMGFNVTDDAGRTDQVNAGNTVKFTNGNNTTVTITPDNVNGPTIKVDVVADGVLTPATTPAPAGTTAAPTPTGSIVSPTNPADQTKLVNAKTVADAINASGFNLKTSAVQGAGEKLTGTMSDGELINPADTVEMVAGKNLTVKQDERGKVTFATKDDVAFNSATIGPVTINDGGINAGDKPITNVAKNLEDVTADTTAQPAGNNPAAAPLNTKLTNAATVSDVLNAGWNLEGNGEAVDAVVHNDVVNFVDGRGTTVSVKKENGKNNIKVDTPIGYVTPATTPNGTPTDSTAPTNTVKVYGADPAAPVTVTNVTSGLPTIPTATPKTGDLVNLNPATNVPDTNVATVGDLRKMGFVVSSNKTTGAEEGKPTEAEFSNQVKNAGEVRFVGTGSATVSANKEGDVNTVTVHVDPANVENTTLTVENGKVKEPSKDANPAGTTPDADKYVNAGDLADTINKTGFSVTANQDATDANGDKLVNAGESINFKNGTGTTATVDGNNVTFNVDKANAPTVPAIGQPDAGKVSNVTGGDTKFLTAQDTINAINNAGFRVIGAGNQTAGSNAFAEDLVNAGDLVTLEAGKNLTLAQDGPKFKFETAKEVQFDKVTVGGDTNPITITSTPVAGGNPTNTISNLTNNLTPVQPTDAKQPDTNNATTAPLDSKLNNAATVSDVINAGWNLEGNGEAVDSVVHNDIVNFVDGNGTTAKVEKKDAKNVVTYDITVDNKTTFITGTTPDGQTVYKHTDGNFYTQPNGAGDKVDAPVTNTAVTASSPVETGTINYNDGNTANTNPANVSTTAGKAEPKAGDTNKVATVGNVADAINASGFKVAANGQANDNLVNPGDTLDFVNGTGTVAQVTNDGKVTFNVDKADKPNVTTTGTAEKPADGDNKFLTANDVIDTINNVGFNVTADSTGTGTKSGEKVQLVKAGETVTYVAGDNLSVVQDGAKFTFATKPDVVFNSVTSNTVTVPGATADDKPVVINQNGINAGDKPITNVGTGTNPTDAANVGQLTKVIEGDNVQVTSEKDASGATVYKVSATATPVNVKTGTVTVDPTTGTATGSGEGDKHLTDANTVAKAINDVGFKVTANDAKAPAKDDSLVNAGEGLNFNDGTNTKVVVDPKTNSVSVNVTGLPVQYTDANGNPVTKVGDNYYPVKEDGTPDTAATPVNPDTIVTNVINPNAKPNEIGAPTKLGNLTGNLEPTSSKADGSTFDKAGDATTVNGGKPTTSQAAPANIGDINNNAATVGDVLNAGFNLKSTDKGDLDFVKAYDTVEFVDGKGTKVETSTDGTTSKIQYNVNADNNTTFVTAKDADDNTIFQDPTNGKFYDKPNGSTDTTAKEVAPKDGTTFITASSPVETGTINYNDGNTANTNPANVSTTAGKAEPKAGDTNKVATVGNVADAINASGFKVAANGQANDNLVNPGDTLDFVNGTGTVAQVTNDGKVTFNVDKADKPNVTTTGTAEKPADGDNKFLTANDVIDTINNVGFNVTADSTGTGTKSGEKVQLVKAGETVTYVAGDNLSVVQDGAKFTFATKPDVVFNSVTSNTVTVPGATADDKPVVINQNGINAGDKPITNVGTGTNPTDAANVGQLTKVIEGDNVQVTSEKDASGATVYKVSATATPVNVKTGTVTVDPTTGTATGSGEGDKHLTDANTVAKAINDVGFKVTANDAKAPAKDDSLVNAGEGLNFNDGTNTKVVVDPKTNSVSVNVTGLPVQYTDANGNPVTKVGDNYYPVKEDGTPDTAATPVNPDTIVTNVINPNAKPNEIGAPTKLGNLTGNLEPTSSKADGSTFDKAGDATTVNGGKPTTSQAAPANIGDINNNAATVGDVLNAGFNLKSTDKGDLDFVKAYDTVEFVDGKGTKVETSTDGTTSKIQYNVNADNNTTFVTAKDADDNTIFQDPTNGKFYDKPNGSTDTTAKEVAPKDGTTFITASSPVETGTINYNDGNTANTNPANVSTTAGKAEPKAGDTNKVATVGNVADAINASGFKVAANGQANDNLVNPGDTLDFVNGTGTVAQVTNDGKVTFNVDKADKPNVTPTGTAEKPADGDNKFLTANDVIDTINNVGFNVTADSTGTGTKSGEKVQLVKAGETVTYVAGDNLSVVQDGAKFTFATKPDVTFNSVTSNTVTVPTDTAKPISITKDGISAGDKVISDVAPGVKPTDAVNVSQLDAVKETVDSANGTVKVVESTNEHGGKHYDLAVNVDGSTIVRNADGTISAIVTKVDGQVGGISATPNGTAQVNSGTARTDAVSAGTVADTINSVGVQLTANKAGDATDANKDGLVNAGEGINFKDGNNTKVTVDGNNVTVNVTGMPVQYTTANGTPVVKVGDNYYPVKADGTPDTAATPVNPADIVTNVINPNAPVNGTGEPTKLGNLLGNLEPTSNTTNIIGKDGKPSTIAEPTKAQVAPTNLAAINNNAATVGDVLNAGWNLQGNSEAVDFVKPYDTVNFVNGKGTNVTVSTDDNMTSTIKFDVNVDNETTFIAGTDAQGNTVYQHTDGNFYTQKGGEGDKVTGDVTNTKVVANASSAPVDEGVITYNDGDQNNTNPNNVATAPVGKATPKAGDANKVATVGNVADAINASGFKVAGNGTASENLVNPGDTLNFKDGNNTKVTVGDDNSVTVNVTGLPVQYTDANGKPVVKVGDNYYPVKADGTPDTTATPVNPADIITNVINPNAPADGKGDTITLGNLLGNLDPTSSKADGSTIGKDGNDLTVNGGKPTTSQTAPDNVKAINNNAATVGDVLNAGFNLKNNTEAKDFVKAYDSVDFANGEGTTATISTDGETSIVKYNVNVDGKTTKVTYVDNQGNALTANTDAQGNTTYTNANGDVINPADVTSQITAIAAAPDATTLSVTGGKVDAPSTTVAAGDTTANADKVVNAGNLAETINKTGFKLVQNDDSVPNNGDDIVNAGEGLNVKNGTGTTAVVEGNSLTFNINKADAPAIPTTGDNAGKVGDVNNGGNSFLTAQDTINAINNAGFTAKANGDAGTLVKAGDVVEFVNGKNIDIVRDGGKFTVATKDDVNFNSVTVGPVTITPAGINAGDTIITGVKPGVAPTDAVNVSQLNSVKETVASNDKTVKVTEGTNEHGGKHYDLAVNVDGSTIVRNADGTLSATVTTVDGKVGGISATANGTAQVNAGTERGDAVSAGTVVDTINASGWAIKDNGEQKDIVNPGESVDFKNGKGTKVTVNSANGATTVQVDSAIEFVNADASDTSTPSATAKLTGTAPVQLGNLASGVRNPDLTTPVGRERGNAILNATGDTLNNAVNVGDLQAAAKLAKTELEDSDTTTVTSRTGDDGQTIYKVNVATTPLKVADGTDPATPAGKVETPAEPNKVATAGDIANAINNAGFTVKANDTGAKGNDLINAGDVLNFVDGANTKAVVDGNTVTFNVTGMPVQYTTVEGNPVVKIGDNYYPVKADGTPDMTAPVQPADIITNVINPAAKPNEKGNTTVLGNIAGNLPDTFSTTTDLNNPTGQVPTKEAVLPPTFTPAQLNNAATVGDVLNAGWNLRTQDQGALDFVKAFDTVEFINGKGTTVVSSTDGKTNKVQYDVNYDNLTINGQKATPNGDGTYSFTVTGGGTGTSGIAGGDTLDTAKPVTSSTVINGQGTKVHVDTQPDPKDPTKNTTVLKVDTPTGYVNTNPADTSTPSNTVKFIGGDDKPVAVTNVASNLTGSPADKSTPAGNAPTTDLGDKLNNVATVGDVLNAGFNVQGNGTAVDVVRHDDTVNFTNGAGTTVTVDNTDGKTTTVKYDVAVDGTSVIVNNDGKLQVNPNFTGGGLTVNGTTNKLEDAGKQGRGNEIINGQGTAVSTKDGVFKVDSAIGYVNDADKSDSSTASDTAQMFGKDASGNNAPVTVTNVGSGVRDEGAVRAVRTLGNGETYTDEEMNGIAGRVARATGGNEGNVYNTANIGDLQAVQHNLQQQINPLIKRIDDVADDANAGVSSAMAMATLPQAYLPGKSMLTGGVATYNGESAVAVGLSKLSDNGRWVLKASGSADTQGNLGGAVGAGFHF